MRLPWRGLTERRRDLLWGFILTAVVGAIIFMMFLTGPSGSDIQQITPEPTAVARAPVATTSISPVPQPGPSVADQDVP